MTAAEITFTVPDAIEVIRQVRREVGDAVVLGAGTVLDPETARAALLAGAEYIVAPTVNLDVIRLCRRYDKAVMPGAFTPTEVARRLGGRGRRREDLPGRRRRPGLPQGPPRPVAADPHDAHRRASTSTPPRASSRRVPAASASAARSSSPRPSPRATSPASATSPRSTPRSSAVPRPELTALPDPSSKIERHIMSRCRRIAVAVCLFLSPRDSRPGGRPAPARLGAGPQGPRRGHALRRPQRPPLAAPHRRRRHVRDARHLQAARRPARPTSPGCAKGD